MPPAGAPGPLDVAIRDKVFTTIDGVRLAAIDAVAFTAPPGSFTTLIGPSGCGKTTTLRIILGLDRDYTGHVRLPAADGRVAAVFQEPRLLPWRTVEQNVRLALPEALAGADLDALFETLGLAAMRGRYPGELSLGLARRAALARAFAIEPALLLLDEPTSALDAESEQAVQQALDRLVRGRTVLLIAHRLSTIARMDRIIVMDQGEIVEQGTHQALLDQNGLYARYWNRQSGGFIGVEQAAE